LAVCYLSNASKKNTINSPDIVSVSYQPLHRPGVLTGKPVGFLVRPALPGLPLASQHMVGAVRQFVSAEESCYRLPELSLLAGSIQTFLAATLPPIPIGFSRRTPGQVWDRNPKGTPGRLRRWLGRTTFSDLPPLSNGRIP
jgi:hypothetical protein